MYDRPVRTLIRVFAAVAAIVAVVTAARYVSAQASTWTAYAAFVTDIAVLEHARPSRVETTVVVDVPYRGAHHRVDVPVDTGYLAAATRVNGSALFGFNRSVRSAAMSALHAQQQRDPFVSALAVRLRTLRTRLGLNDDDYVDLMVRTVQAIPYGTLHRSTFMPAATVAGNSGVCSDKSILLASLLEHEGYDAGVWVFPTQAHAAVALRGTGPGFRSSGYCLVETTKVTYIGEVDHTLRAAGPICEVPQLITLGSGQKRYTRDVETEFIADTIERINGPRWIIPLRPDAATQPANRHTDIAARIPGHVSHPAASDRLAWIESNRDRPDVVYAALVSSGSGR